MTDQPALMSAWVLTVGWALLHFVWQGSLLHALLAITLRLVPTKNSGARYMLALATLALMAMTPVATAVYVSMPPRVESFGAAHGLSGRVAVEEPLPSLATAQAHFAEIRERTLLTAELGALASTARTLQEQAPGLMRWLVTAWLVGAGFFTVRLAGGLVLVERWRRETSPAIPAWLLEMTQRLAARMRLGAVPVRVSCRASAPMVIGYLRPVVIVPTSALLGMAPAQLELILAHELVHVKRLDPLVSLLQGAVEALLFYHPSVWKVSRIVRNEREHSCDRLTASLFTTPSEYARALAKLADLVADARTPGVPASGGALVERVRRVLGSTDRPTFTPGAAAAIATLLALGGIGTAFALSCAYDPVARLTANPYQAERLGEEQLVQLLRRAPWLQEPRVLALLKAVAPLAAKLDSARTYYLYAANTLGVPAREKALDYLLVQDQREAPASPTVDTVTIGPNEEPNYRSIGYLRAPLLEPGFDLDRAHLATRDGSLFPPGRQFVYIQQLLPPGDGLDRTRLLERLDLSRIRNLAVSHTERLHVLLVKAASIDYFVPQFSNPDFDIAELWAQPDVSELEGPWKLWVDAENIVTHSITIAEYPLPDGTVASIPAAPQYACIEDGKVLGSLAGYWINANDRFVLELFEDCMSGAWGRDWDVVSYGAGRQAPPLRLRDDTGRLLTSHELAGQPFLLLAPAPLAEVPLQVPVGRSTFATAQPDPKTRLQQVEDVIAETGADVRLLVVALPYVQGGVLWDAASVASSLREQLAVSVFEDESGAFMKTYGQFVSRQNPLLLFGADGRILDAYVDMAKGQAAFVGIEEAPELADGLLRIGQGQR